MNSTRFVSVLALASIALLVGCKKPAPTTDAPPPPPPAEPVAKAATPASPAFAVDDKVDVKWNGSWWKGQVLETKGSKYRVHYVGWSSTWDEDVSADRLRAPQGDAKEGTEKAAAVTAPSTNGRYKVGDKVDVEWKGSWWKGTILSVSGDQYKIHYVGWGSSFDETVGTSRLRARTAGAKKGSGPN